MGRTFGEGAAPVEREVRLGVDLELPDDALIAVFDPGLVSAGPLMTN